jgi:outer membrane murein-binding lipoprotein Lpp
MTTGADARASAQRNFEQAKINKRGDLAETTTPDQAGAVVDNYEAAMAAYLQTLIAGFDEATGDWDALKADADAAEEELTEARERAEGIAEKIEAAAKLTGAVTTFVNAVKGQTPPAA